MQILYRTPPGSGSYSVLADEAHAATADRISQYRPAVSKTPQEDALAFSNAPFIQDRGNGRVSFSFVVDRIHPSADDAITFLTQQAALFLNLQANFDLQIILVSGVAYMANCAVTRFEPDPHSDQSTRCTYEFVGPNYTLTAP